MRALSMALLILLLPRLARADEPTARRHYERARGLVKLGDHRGAIREFELSYLADPRPNRLYDLAQQHRILAETGSLVELRTAVTFFERYLKEKPDAEDRQRVNEYLADLRLQIAAAESAERDTSMRPGPDGSSAGKSATSDAPRSTLPLVPDGSEPAPQTRKVPTWGWVLVGVGAAVVAGGAIGLGVGLSQDPAPPATTLGGFGVK